MTDDDHSRPGYHRNGHSSNGTAWNGRAHLVSIRALDVLPADPAEVRGSGPPGIGPEVAPEPAAIDVVLVREVRGAVAGQLATRLQTNQVQDPGERRELARALITDELAQRARARVRAGEDPWPVEVEFATARAVMAALFGLGRLQPLVDDLDVENIEVDGRDRVWVSYADGREEPGPAVAESDAELIETLQLLAARSGSAERTFSSAHPVLHLRLDDGSRLTAMAWVTPQPHVVIRRHRVRDVDLDDLVTLGTLDTALAAFLRAALRAGKNIVVTGLQNAGKTTLIRALANEFAPMERFATIEKEYELHLQDLPDRHPRVVAMEAREGSSEKDRAGRRAGEVTLTDLVTDALRMNLRRIIVGEVRGGEVLPMLEAMSTGDGSLCTIHARTAQHAIDRIVTLCLSAGVSMTDTFAYRLLAGSVDFFVHLTLLDESAAGGRKHRFVSQVVEITGLGEGARPATTAVFGPGPDGRAVPLHRPGCLPDLVRAGFDPTFLEQRAGTWTTPLDTIGGAS
ncbi:CpaF family protein [Cellulomonas fimi]|uniref:CpaF family protein n=1 Tax=Cellulomonas fimi TaxID=1708 RepID=A0A7Y0LVX2_CELFI|nr:CpaF/VirB11 family protein [Cellulomonas fimi]NMR19226.1 CpaF family protein [Cellulomonas fimi]